MSAPPALQALVTVKWGDSVVATRHLAEGASAIVGADPDTMIPLPCEALGVPAVTVAVVREGAPIAFIPKGSLAFRERANDLPAPLAGPTEVTLGAGDSLAFSIGRFQITIAAEARAKAPWGALAPLRTSLSPVRYVAIAALAHAFLIGLSAGASQAHAFEPEEPAVDAMKAYLAAAEERSKTPDHMETTFGDAALGKDINGEDGNGKDGGGARAAGTEGSMGSTASRSRSRARYAVTGRDDGAESIAASREEALQRAAEFGITSLLREQTQAPIDTFGQGAASVDPFAASGAMWATDVGETFGAGGLGLQGVGEGGGGRGVGSIGMGEIGTLGHTFGKRGLGTGGAGAMAMGVGSIGWGGSYSCGDPTGLVGSFGTIGRIGRVAEHGPVWHVERPEKVKEEGESRLPAETIRRIVRQSGGRFRACYQTALLANPSLSGGVTTRFFIGAGGAVQSAQNVSADLPDKSVVSCVTRVFGSLVFPDPPDGRPVTVTYPLSFSPEN